MVPLSLVTAAISMDVSTSASLSDSDGNENWSAVNPVTLVLSADEHFGLPLGVTVHSALRNLEEGRNAEVYVLDGGLTDETKKRLERIVVREAESSLHFIEPDLERYRDSRLGTQVRFTPVNYARIHAAEYLPTRIQRAIYLDADVVVEHDLGKLWSMDFDGNVLLAVQDQLIPFVSSSMGVRRWRELGLQPDMPFFNSGVMVMNLERYRQEEIGAQVFDYLLRYRDELNLFGNQEGFNSVLAGRWKSLDLRWNVIHVAFDPQECEDIARREGFRVPHSRLTQDPYIIHFTADTKPWHPYCRHPARTRFYDHLQESSFLSWPEYLLWRARHRLLSFVEWLRHASRPYRHKLRRKKTSGE